jgi:hypothetical protein
MEIAPEPAAREVSVTTHEPDRAYRLRGDEPLPDGLRRIVRGQLLDAQQALASPPAGDAVHAVRKRMKRLRSVLRLGRAGIDDDTRTRENAAYRDAGRELAAGRDAQVRLETLDRLTRRAGAGLPERITAPLRLRLHHEREAATSGQTGAALAATGTALEHALGRTHDWTFAGEDVATLRPGLQRIYRRGRRGMRAVQRDPSPEHLHAWRKRVKDLWHAAELMREAKPKALKKTARRAHTLAGLLGDAHDLHVLREYVEAHPDCFEDGAAQRVLIGVIDRRERKLCAKALKRGRKLYRRSPKRFARAIENGWRKRHAASPPGAPGAPVARAAGED